MKLKEASGLHLFEATICIQEVRGSSPLSSTNSTIIHKTYPEHLPISPNSYAQLDIPLHCLIEELRHSFAISFLRNGANPFELQIALGHTTLEMTRKYTQALGFEDVFKRHVMASPVDRLIK